MKVVDVIPTGQENAISRSNLARITGESDREVRKQIEAAIRQGDIIINLCDGKGYFRPIPNKEDHLVKQALKINESRLKEISRKSVMYERYLA